MAPRRTSARTRRRPARRGAAGGRSRVLAVPDFRRRAEARLKGFRGYSRLAVAITALLLLIWTGGGEALQELDATAEAQRSAGEATRAFQGLLMDLVSLLPKLGFALAIVALAALVTRLSRTVLRRVLGNWTRADAVSAIIIVVVWLTALAAAVSVVAGNSRALFGSVGLLGLALSWALQAPIESFAGWLVNSFRGYYRIGDRVAVGDVFGDVYRIDVLTTTVWEAGGPDKPVQGAQPTGALVTFPNFEVLRTNIVNYTRDFPYVWDEIRVGVANESDPEYTMRVLGEVARRVVGPAMLAPAQRYRTMMESEGLSLEVAEEPQLYLEPGDAWTNVVVRYLVPARERRTWASRLHLTAVQELAKPEHHPRIRALYPTQRVQLDGTGPAPL